MKSNSCKMTSRMRCLHLTGFRYQVMTSFLLFKIHNVHSSTSSGPSPSKKSCWRFVFAKIQVSSWSFIVEVNKEFLGQLTIGEWAKTSISMSCGYKITRLMLLQMYAWANGYAYVSTLSSLKTSQSLEAVESGSDCSNVRGLLCCCCSSSSSLYIGGMTNLPSRTFSIVSSTERVLRRSSMIVERGMCWNKVCTWNRRKVWITS